MYNLEETSYGFRITATGTMDATKAEQLKAELLQALCAHTQPFSLLVDIRGLIPTGPVVLEAIQEMQSVCRLMSLRRTAVIISSPELKEYIQQSGSIAGTTAADRFIDASKIDDWEDRALAWVKDAIEPTVISAL
jgi:anti-anti-sigma regulatory factor